MSAPAIGDINIVCTDVERSLAFYHHALGLQELGRDEGAIRLLLASTTVLLLPSAKRARPPADYPEEATISFDVIVDDLETTVERLENAGGERMSRLGGGDGWVVRDPDGNVVEVIQRR